MTPEVASHLVGRPVTALTPTRGSGNSRVFRADCADGTIVAIKVYPPRAADPRDRMGAETEALRFLQTAGESTVPRVLVSDADTNCAVFEWIDGVPVGEPSPADMDAAMDFLSRIHAGRDRPEAAGLPLASEACLSGGELLSQLDRRFAKLAAVDAPDLAALLAQRVRPGLAAARDRLGAVDADLEPCWRTLSPSDFGFHNTLRRPDGTLAFIDFEYFGWDDPVKLVADTLLHPGMALGPDLQRRALARAIAIYGADPGFSSRLRLMYPLFALRWVAIICNEFLPERWAVRAHAGAADREAAQARQLAKAQALLDRLPRDLTEVLDAA